MELTAEQKAAVDNSHQHRVSIITGGPGVGKTATTAAILAAHGATKENTIMLAPTGKAARRITEQTNMPAYTIHKAIHAESIELSKPKLVIVDEMSMVDTLLFARLLAQLPLKFQRLVLVGDVDQLPSIGAGQVLRDLIDSGTIPTTRLTQIFRQASESEIPHVARAINQGETPDFDPATGDVRFCRAETAGDVRETIVAAVQQLLSRDDTTLDDLQVLVPQHKGECGTIALNKRLQEQLNPQPDKAPSLRLGELTVYAGDRVMQTKNDYTLGVYNGDVGTVVKADFRGVGDLPETTKVATPTGPQSLRAVGIAPSQASPFVLLVRYPNIGEVAYTISQAQGIVLSYAITIHKSQGSQFKTVILPVHSAHKFMLTRALLYTAITRASEMVLFVGDQSMLGTAAADTRGSDRRTTLHMYLTESKSET